MTMQSGNLGTHFCFRAKFGKVLKSGPWRHNHLLNYGLWSWNTDLISSIVWDQNIWGRFDSKGWHPWVALYLSCLICVVLCWVELCGWVKSQQNATLSEVTGTSWDVVRSDIRYKICVAWAPTDVEHEECLSSSGAADTWCRPACLVSSAQCPHLHPRSPLARSTALLASTGTQHSLCSALTISIRH